MKLTVQLKLEELARFALTYLTTLYLGYSWWMFWVWLLVPDLSMLGYLVNTKVGALVYNFFHNQALGIAVFVLGFFMTNTELQFAGLILAGHSSFDRMLGYGLKYSDSFQHTHLGRIGKSE